MEFQRMPDGRLACPFDHHSKEFGEHYFEIFDEMRGESPLVWSDLHGGFWIATTQGRLAMTTSVRQRLGGRGNPGSRGAA